MMRIEKRLVGSERERDGWRLNAHRTNEPPVTAGRSATLLHVVPNPASNVQREIAHAIEQSAREILDRAAAGAAPDELERKVAAWSCALAQQLLAAAFSRACEVAIEADL